MRSGVSSPTLRPHPSSISSVAAPRPLAYASVVLVAVAGPTVTGDADPMARWRLRLPQQ